MHHHHPPRHLRHLGRQHGHHRAGQRRQDRAGRLRHHPAEPPIRHAAELLIHHQTQLLIALGVLLVLAVAVRLVIGNPRGGPPPGPDSPLADPAVPAARPRLREHPRTGGALVAAARGPHRPPRPGRRCPGGRGCSCP